MTQRKTAHGKGQVILQGTGVTATRTICPLEQSFMKIERDIGTKKKTQKGQGQGHITRNMFPIKQGQIVHCF